MFWVGIDACARRFDLRTVFAENLPPLGRVAVISLFFPVLFAVLL